MNGIKFKDPADEARFTTGPAFHSLDGGKTWIAGPPPPVKTLSKFSFHVTEVDEKTRTITIDLTRAP